MNQERQNADASGCIGLALSVLLGTLSTSAQRRVGAEAQEDFRFRFVGPMVGNRVASIAGVPGDPATTASQADLEASVRLTLRIRDDISACSDMVNPMEWMRKQLEDRRKILAVETKILERAQMLSDDKCFVEQYKIYMNLIWLNGEVGPGGGDVAGGTDFGPTETSLTVFHSIDSDLNAVKAEFRNLMDKDVPAFNRAVSDQGVTPLAVGMPDTASTLVNGRRP
jgi:hypothetical protein